jgi:hypothetical protein
MNLSSDGKHKTKTKFLGRHLMVKGSFVDKILSGRKRTTIRLGRYRTKYSEIIIHGGGRPIAKARIVNVVYKKVADLNDEDAKKDGFSSVSELLRELKRVYGEVSPEDDVTIIEFEVVQDLSKLEPTHPYLGLRPEDVARLALRYLSETLNEEERKVLRELTVSRSIRMAAIRLYGNLGMRWKVRKVLRRALEMLVRQGYIKAGQRAKRGDQ